MNPIARFFDKVNDMIRGAEYSALNLLGAVVVWTVLMIPASFVMESTKTLGYENAMIMFVPVPLIVGFNTAVLGIMIVSQFFMTLKHNLDHKRSKQNMRFPKWQLALQIVLYALYFSIVITMVVLEQYPDDERVQLVARIMLTTAEIPATVIAGLRTWQTSILMGEEKAQNKRKLTKEIMPNEDLPSVRKSSLTSEDWAKIRRMNTKEIVSAYGGTIRRAQQWKEEVK